MATNHSRQTLPIKIPADGEAGSLTVIVGGKSANDAKSLADRNSGELEQACLALLSSRVFSELLPDERVDKETALAARRVTDALAVQGEAAINLENPASLLVERVAFASRGKRLHQRGPDLTHRLSLVTRAMLTGQCLTAQYNLRTRELHPYGVIVREPKIYLLAVETDEGQAENNGNSEPVIKQYLFNRFDSLDISTRPNNVPVDFNVKDYMDQGHMDVTIPELENTLGRQFELVLGVREHRNDALIRDLQDFALGNQQQAFIKADNDGNYLLTVPNQAPTYALSEWLLGRTDRVEVLQPAALRHYMLDRLQATTRLYAGDAEPLQPREIADLPESSAESEETELQLSDDKLPAPISRYASSNKANTLVAGLVVRILSEIRIDKHVLNDHDTWCIDPLFDGEIREFVKEEDVDGFRAWIKKQSDFLESEEPDHEDTLLVNVHDAAALIGLNEAETDLLCLAALLSISAPLRHAMSLINESPTEQDAYQIISMVTLQPIEDIINALQDSSTLRKSGLIGRCPISIISMQDVLKMPGAIVANLFAHHERLLGILSGLTQSSPEPQISQNDLEHLADQLTLAENYLKGASEQKVKACNILLWGRPGTGKTQLARYLSSKLSLNSYEVLSIAKNGQALREQERISSYMLIQAVLERTNESIVIFDEVENIIDPCFSVREEISKASLNELLESNPVPSIWISNSVEDVDPAYLRRFDMVIEVPVPDFAAKKRVAQRILNDVPFNGELLDAFLERSEVGPAFLKKIRRVAELAGATSEQDVSALATNLLDNEIAINGGMPAVLPGAISNRAQIPTLPYDFSLINASEDLGALANTIDSSMSVKFCLYGPPGTGKTAWAKKLADQLKRPAHVVQASDIKDKYVGESEKKIAKAFLRAEKEDAVLIFDEVDTFLRSRDEMKNEHSVSSTNQFLTSLENYNGLLVCSTNLMDNMDKASLRRFDFKVKFHYLTAAQANQLLVTTAGILGMNLTVNDLITRQCSLQGDTYAPGDYAVALKRSTIRTGETTLEQLCADIKAEAEIRNAKQHGRPIGFLHSA